MHIFVWKDAEANRIHGRSAAVRKYAAILYPNCLEPVVHQIPADRRQRSIPASVATCAAFTRDTSKSRVKWGTNPSILSEDDSDQRARYFRMFSAWPFQPLEFMLNAFARRDSGMASKPDSTMVSCVPPPASSSVNDTSVVGSAE